MAKTTYSLRGVRRNLRKRDLSAGPGNFRTIPDGHEIGDIELTIDLDLIARELGEKAMHNKTGRAVKFSGLIVARVVKRERFAQ